MPMERFTNAVLSSFPPSVIDRLNLKPVQFPVGASIEVPGRALRNIYFLEEGVASLTTHFRDGTQVETGMFGSESAIGISAIVGSNISLNRVSMQIPGRGFACSRDHAREEFALGAEFQRTILNCMQIQFERASQAAGCIAMHPLEARLARWLLGCADKARTEKFRMPHATLADLLGSSRSTVSIAAGHLKDQGLIQYTRGGISIVNRLGLEARACECYSTVRNYVERSYLLETFNPLSALVSQTHPTLQTA